MHRRAYTHYRQDRASCKTRSSIVVGADRTHLSHHFRWTRHVSGLASQPLMSISKNRDSYTCWRRTGSSWRRNWEDCKLRLSNWYQSYYTCTIVFSANASCVGIEAETLVHLSSPRWGRIFPRLHHVSYIYPACSGVILLASVTCVSPTTDTASSGGPVRVPSTPTTVGSSSHHGSLLTSPLWVNSVAKSDPTDSASGSFSVLVGPNATSYRCRMRRDIIVTEMLEGSVSSAV